MVHYQPAIGLLLNKDKDHQEIDELISIFGTFKKNTKQLFIVNRSNVLAKQLSADNKHDFSADPLSGAGYIATGFKQDGLAISFDINGVGFNLHTVGRHN